MKYNNSNSKRYQAHKDMSSQLLLSSEKAQECVKYAAEIFWRSYGTQNRAL